MSIFIFILIIFCFLYFIKKLFTLVDINILSEKSHPLGLFFIIQIFVYSFPGVLAISFFNYSSFRYEAIDDSVKLYAGFWYLYSLCCILYILVTLLYIFRIKYFNKKIGFLDSKFNYARYAKTTILLSLFFMFFKIILSDTSPLIMALKGNVNDAYLLRVDLQRNSSILKIPYLDGFIELLFSYQFMLLVYLNALGIKFNYFWKLISFLIVFYALTYDLQKAPFIFIMLCASFMIFSVKGNAKRLAKNIILIFIVLSLFYMIMMDMDSSLVIERIFERVFLAQNQGYYHILNSILPSDEYLYQGFYMINKFGIYPSRADIDIVPYIYGGNTNIVNSNSYFLGQAWSMYGYWGLIFSPFIVAFCIFIYLKVFDVMTSIYPVLIIPYMFYIIPKMQLNQSFTFFLWGRSLVVDLLSLLVVLSLTTLCYKISCKK